MNAERLYPGMRDGGLEIYLEDEDKLKAIKNGQIKNFEDLDFEETLFIANIIDTDEVLKNILQEWWPENKKRQIWQVAKCRFGGLNHIPDLTTTGEINSDYIQCSFRGFCKGEGIVCKPIEYQGVPLTSKEIKAIQLMSTNKKNAVVCEELNIAEGSFNVFRTQLYVKLGNINTKQEVTRIGVQLGIC